MKPPAAGIQPIPPEAVASSMAGINRLQTEAAIITPAAKPRKILWIKAFTVLRKKKTIDAPKAVIKKVKPVPSIADTTGGIVSPPYIVSYL